MIIGVTGNFGSGKSTICKQFEEHSCKVIDVDALYHDLLNTNKELHQKIENTFGTANRKELREIVFNDREKLKELNALTHPIILRELKKNIEAFQELHEGFTIVVDIPLLYEAKAEGMFDVIIAVKCDKEVRIERSLGAFTQDEIEKILDAQMPTEEKCKRADYVIDNSGHVDETAKQVTEILEKILKS